MGQIRVGKPDVAPDTPSHVKGVRQGNQKRAHKHQVGHNEDDTADARRSTGVRPGKENPILPIMPNLSPS
ncbi:hypothetical protein [Nonomuraea ferruginea]|uniref:Uncharacterized protein n=1 Tax=Nonomuraea ferruginea TaxID=46174 RepID=A0ABT4T6K4_9ACTN|nr:hypothetical protein [Nonomuraea ferruginea]MDA0645137.1 hypothetical protein [Nonomuraea ferruginea]